MSHFACFVTKMNIDRLVSPPQGSLILCNPLKLTENEVLFSVHGGNFIAVDVLDPGSDIVVVGSLTKCCATISETQQYFLVLRLHFLLLQVDHKLHQHPI